MPLPKSSCDIFVNRRPFSVDNHRPTGADIAALLGVPADNAVVERHNTHGDLEIVPIDQPFEIAPAQSFLVTRQFVMGGCCPHPLERNKI